MITNYLIYLMNLKIVLKNDEKSLDQEQSFDSTIEWLKEEYLMLFIQI